MHTFFGKPSRNLPCLLLLTLLLFISYSNSFQAAWHLDDIPNILLNTPLHISDLSWQSIKPTFYAFPGHPDKLVRPVSYFSFALNWLVHQDRIFGYHLVNLLIHLLVSFFLYGSCLLLLSTPALDAHYQGNKKYFIAALAAIFWAINPVQTQAVTYIVQRMASLATLFTIISIWFYLKARLLPAGYKHSKYCYLGALLTFLLAMGCKENAILLPASLFLVELFFFQHRLQSRKFFWTIVGVTLFILATILLLVGPDFIHKILNGYNDRSFGPWQRFLTESRIVIFYLSLLFFPSPQRMSITHDIELSSSLLLPITTLPAIIFLVLLTVLPLLYRKKYPILCFVILFFLLNHIIESTIIPLELIFEHRNYLPSLFLFLPAAVAINQLCEYSHKNRLLYSSVCTSAVCLILLLSLGTLTRNSIWQTEKKLWSDSLIKAPDSARSYTNLAHTYWFDENNLEKAFELYHQSLGKQSPTPWKDQLLAFNSMGMIMTQVGNYPQALIFYDRALAVSRDGQDSQRNSDILYHKAETLWLDKESDKAITLMTQLVDVMPREGRYSRLLGELLLAQGKKSKALGYMRETLAKSTPESFEYQMTVLDLSLLYSKMGIAEKADFYLRYSTILHAPFIPSLLSLLELSLQANRINQAEFALNNLTKQLAWSGLKAVLEGKVPEYRTFPLDYPMLKEYAYEKHSSK